jgi:hypothetical protein
MMQSMVTLFHFTSKDHLVYILQDGYLEVTDGVLAMDRADPKVVWLSTSDSAGEGFGLQYAPVDKTAVRFEVSVPKVAVHKWRDWAKSHGSKEEHMKLLSSKGGGAGTWRVVQRRIDRTEWVKITDMINGEEIDFSAKDDAEV